MRGVKAALCRMIAKDRRAVTSVEYGLIGLLVFVAIIAGVTGVGTKLTPIFSTISSAL
jgi:pilus assembly protein Flp/PilA